MEYTPTPIDTRGIELSPELLELTEKLAENVHEQWARKRMDEGWQYGPYRDDIQKLNPCIAPYDELPESEKAYDRETAMETIKVLLKLGYTICKEKTD